jgi:hypothetical protein
MPTGDTIGVAPVIIPVALSPIAVLVAVTVIPSAVRALAALVLVRIGKRGRGYQSDGTNEEKTFQHWAYLIAVHHGSRSYSA